MIRRGVWIVILVIAAAGCSKDAKKSAIESAEAWLAKVDGGDYSGSWDQAAAFFRQAVTRDQWIASLTQVRTPLGKCLKREVLGAQEMTNLPGAPPGEYVVIQFSADFANKKGAVETVTPMREDDGSWRVSGYYIK